MSPSLKSIANYWQNIIHNTLKENAMSPQEFLNQMALTANALDFDAHMNLISKEVRVLGVPGFDVIGYDDWHRQCKQEFSDKLLKQVSYQGLDVLDETPGRVTFKSIETVGGTDGTNNTSVIEFIIQKEEDGQWRVVQEHVLPYGELINNMRLKGH